MRRQVLLALVLLVCAAGLLGICPAGSLAQTADKAPVKQPSSGEQVNTLDPQTLQRMLLEGDPEQQQAAAKSIQASIPKEREALLAISEAVKTALANSRDAAAERELRLALGRLAAGGVEDAAEWGFESMSVTHSKKTPPAVFQAHVAALEMVPGAAKELMIGNLDVALNFPDADPKERQRLKEFVTLTAEAMRTRELAVFLDALLTGEDDLFVKIEAPLEIRLLACYRKLPADAGIKADAVADWLEKHPGGPLDVEVAALETIAALGTTKAGRLENLAERTLAKPQDTLIVGRRIVADQVDRRLAPVVKIAIEKHAQGAPSEDLRRLMKELR